MPVIAVTNSIIKAILVLIYIFRDMESLRVQHITRLLVISHYMDDILHAYILSDIGTSTSTMILMIFKPISKSWTVND